MSANPETSPVLKPGATYRFFVRSAEEAVRTIRERLGENAKVLSVRQVPSQGLAGLIGRPKLEVIAQIPEPEPAPAASILAASTEAASPIASDGRAMTVSSAALLRAGLSPTRDVPTRLPDLLRRSGFSEALVGRLQGSTAISTDDQRPLHHALVEVGQQLRRVTSRHQSRPLPARTAFLGTPGVGRTTALCKWLAREVFARQRMGSVVKAEFERPNPAEGLAVFCEALGISLNYHAAVGSETYAPMPPATVSAAEGSFLYADLPGISVRSPAENAAVAKFLDEEKFSGRVLVLNAVYDLPMLRRAYAAGRDLGATHLVFTHLDELEHWGKLWDFLIDGELTPLFLATGPSLTGDCEEDTIGAVLRRTLPGA